MKPKTRDKSIGAQMAIALQLMKRKNHKAILDIGHKITMEQLAILEELATNGEMNMTQLADAIWKQNANITRMVDKLEGKELIARMPVAGDRRANLLVITEKGKQVFKEVLAVVIKKNKDTWSYITVEERELMLGITKKLITGLTKSSKDS